MSKKIIFTNKAPHPIGPYSQAVLANDTLYISMQLPMNAKTRLLEMDSLEVQVEQVMYNIGVILEEVSMDYTNIVKSSIFITDMDNFLLINDVYAKYFKSHEPARELCEVSWLPKDVDVAISCIAVKS